MLCDPRPCPLGFKVYWSCPCNQRDPIGWSPDLSDPTATSILMVAPHFIHDATHIFWYLFQVEGIQWIRFSLSRSRLLDVGSRSRLCLTTFHRVLTGFDHIGNNVRGTLQNCKTKKASFTDGQFVISVVPHDELKGFIHANGHNPIVQPGPLPLEAFLFWLY